MDDNTRSTSILAVTSLVFGILGWTFLPFVGSIVAIVTGHLARGELRRRRDLEGDALAVTGLVLGWTMIGFSLLVLFAILVFFGGLAALAWAASLGGAGLAV